MLRKLTILVIIVLAGLMAVSTGAFTSLSTDRGADVRVAGDAIALLSFASTSAFSHYQDDMLTIDFDDVAADGVNTDAITYLDGVFSVTNNGSNAVMVSISKSGPNASSVDFGHIEEGIVLDVGQSCLISMTIDSRGLSPGDELIDHITLNAVTQ
ncbi:MAG: hypothetical protein JW825_01650 [Candidatus Methanofastidiosa archaeon]|nr:hypothetical protein [Candidatus Methanofastidiosa archaeon]